MSVIYLISYRVYSKKYKSIEYIEMRCKKSNWMIKKQQGIKYNQQGIHRINSDLIESDVNCKEFIESTRNLIETARNS